MTFDQMIKRLDAVNAKQGLNPEVVPHGRNLRFQLERRDAKKRAMYERIFRGYMEMRNVKYDVPLRDYIKKIVACANSYLDLFWPKSPCRKKNSEREARKKQGLPPFDIDAELILDLYHRVVRHINAIWWNPADAVETGKIINRPI